MKPWIGILNRAVGELTKSLPELRSLTCLISDFNLPESIQVAVASDPPRSMPPDHRREARPSTHVSKVKMANSPAPFSAIGGRAKAILTADYSVGHRLTVSFPSSNGMGLTATCLQRGHIFSRSISIAYKCGNAYMSMKMDSDSKVLTNVTHTYVFRNTKTALSFHMPDHKSSKLNVHYTHPYVTASSSIGLNITPVVALSAKELCLGGEIAFDTVSATYKQLSTGIAFNKPDFSASLILVDQGQTLKGSYVHDMPDNATTVAAELIHRFSSGQNIFTIGSSHKVNQTTLVKTRFSNDGKVAMLCQREWRPKSIVTVSARGGKFIHYPSIKIHPFS